MGAMMGGGVGLTIGFLFGSYSILRYVLSFYIIIFSPCLPLLIFPNAPYFYFPLIYRQGAGPRGILATLSQYMLGSAASFAFFLSIGSVRSLFRLMIYILAFLSNYMANR